MNALIRVQYDTLPTVEVREHAEDSRGNVFTLLRPIERCGVIVPAGFESDGASVPRLLWGVVFPRDDRQALFAALFHDYVYRTHPLSWTRYAADLAFRTFLLAGGVAYHRVLLAYAGVRLFGRKAWKEAKKRGN